MKRILIGFLFWLVAGSLAFGQGITCSTGYYCSGPQTAATDVVALPLAADSATVVVNVSGTFSGTLVFEGGVVTQDGGVVWAATTGTPIGGGTSVSTSTATGQWRFTASGLTHFRVRCSVYASGRIYSTISASKGSAAAINGGVAGAAPFSVISSGTNTTAAMVVGAGASLATTSTGTIAATSLTDVLIQIATPFTTAVGHAGLAGDGSLTGVGINIFFLKDC